MPPRRTPVARAVGRLAGVFGVGRAAPLDEARAVVADARAMDLAALSDAELRPRLPASAPRRRRTA